MSTLTSKTICALLILLGVVIFMVETKQFEYNRYPFKKKKDDKVYRSNRIRCDENSDVCKRFTGLAHTKCLRQCMSEKCYQEIYSFDELEAGEIDVRLNSFKGCLAQESRRYKEV